MTDVAAIARALVSVWDKAGLAELGAALAARGIEILASGGTAEALEAAGIRVVRVEDETGAPEILGGRVKTLHPAIHAAILARRDRAEDRADLAARGIRPIDLVIVDLYPFDGARGSEEERTELVDIGGVALIRAAAKNWRHVGVLTDPGDRAPTLAEIEAAGGLTAATRRRLAAKAMRRTAWYDARIAAWLTDGEEGWPERWPVGAELVRPLRYGENPHQAAALYRDRPARADDLAAAHVLQGKELSYNNLLDVDAARRLARDLAAIEPDHAHATIVKHTIPCGAARGASAAEAYERARACDPVSAFGGVVALDRPVDGDLARRLTETFLEVVWAPAFDADARAALAAKKNLRVLEGPMPVADAAAWEVRRVGGGLLVQTPNAEAPPSADALGLATAGDAAPALRADLAFAWAVCRAVASNAIVLARDGATIGIGGGQTSRVGAVRLALARARETGHDPAGSALASDGFFPFADGVEEAAAGGVAGIVQPGGSIKDAEVVAAAERAGIPMALTGVRQFRH